LALELLTEIGEQGHFNRPAAACRRHFDLYVPRAIAERAELMSGLSRSTSKRHLSVARRRYMHTGIA
jgi:hypothetical protein